jgi:hypothetical protein
LRVTSVAAKTQVDPDSGANKVTGYDLMLQGVEAPITVPAKGLVPVVFTMKEMGIDYPVVFKDSPINPNFKIPNPNFDPSAVMSYPGGNMGTGTGMGGPGAPGGAMGSFGSGGRASGAGGAGSSAAGGAGKGDAEKGAESTEPQFLTVPRFDFIVQFIWQETLLTKRLEKQVEDWEKEKQKTGAPADTQGDLAATTKGGA